MSRTSTIQKKEQILMSARKIFYDQGYENAYLEHIAKDCGLSKQLLIYYYPNKAALANALFDQIGLEIKHLIEKKMYLYFGGMDDLQVGTAVELKLSALMYLRDEKAMRFQRETAFLVANPSSANTNMTFYEMHAQKYDLDVDPEKDELKMISDIVDVSAAILLSNYSYGMYRCPEDQFLDYMAEMLYTLMKVPKERIAEINRMSNSILELLDFHFKPYFVID